ncbi:MAG: Holliday junction branch migration protein RuvA [Melioribacteraceae bacterium]|nr:Holliday junction branch migration protein RuvA [Melioribacteraceae bacterium]
MIGYLTGKIVSKKPTQIILDVNGVGYLINITLSTFDKLVNDGEKISLHTYLNVKEDALNLFGFFTAAEKEMFELLIGINGIGPKLAQSILSGIQVGDLKDALHEGNLSRIVAIPGVGRKTAERLIVELREKVDKIITEGERLPSGTYSIKEDAVAALTSLGYNPKAADRIVRKILEEKPGSSIEELIKEALSAING